MEQEIVRPSDDNRDLYRAPTPMPLPAEVWTREIAPESSQGKAKSEIREIRALLSERVPA
jgi:hypothetical protein